MMTDSAWSSISHISIASSRKNVSPLLKGKLNNVVVRDRMLGMKMMILINPVVATEMMMMIAIHPEEGIEDTRLEIL